MKQEVDKYASQREKEIHKKQAKDNFIIIWSKENEVVNGVLICKN